MVVNVYYFLISLLILISGLISHYWFGNYYNKSKFKVFLPFISTVTSILFSTAIIIQVINYNSQKAQAEIDHYNSLSKIFLDDTIELFIQHPEMNYYYNDLMGIKLIDNNTKRNILLENQISMLIFSRLAKFAIFVQTTDDHDTSSKIQNWMGHVAKTFMKSPTLRNYWINEYKPKLAGPASKQYMKDNFNL
jgi:hypothetical protein